MAAEDEMTSSVVAESLNGSDRFCVSSQMYKEKPNKLCCCLSTEIGGEIVTWKLKQILIVRSVNMQIKLDFCFSMFFPLFFLYV